MDKRKYIIIFLLLFPHYISTSKAEAWLADTNKFKYNFSYGFLDKYSIKQQKQRREKFLLLQSIIGFLYKEKSYIYENADKQDRDLYFSEKKYLEQLDKEIQDLKREANVLSSFYQRNISSFQTEYGINDKSAFGLKIDYINYKEINKLSSSSGKKISYSQSIFYKYKLYQNDTSIITTMPKITLSHYNYSNLNQIYELYLMFGHSKYHKKFNVTKFFEGGVAIRKQFNKSLKKNIGFVFFTQEGFQTKNNFIISNYSEYERNNYQNEIYNILFYNQLSIAKEFFLEKSREQKITIQAGYFWKNSLLNKNYKISGPIISLWFEI